jgi:hypothetical protein
MFADSQVQMNNNLKEISYFRCICDLLIDRRRTSLYLKRVTQ